MNIRQYLRHYINQIEKETGERIQDRCGTRGDQYFNGTTQKGESYISGCVYGLKDIRGYFDELLRTYTGRGGRH